MSARDELTGTVALDARRKDRGDDLAQRRSNEILI